MKSYSHSRLQDFLLCPWKAWADTIRPGQSAPAAETGTLLHEWEHMIHVATQNMRLDDPRIEATATNGLKSVAAHATRPEVRQDVLETGAFWLRNQIAEGRLPRQGHAELPFGFDRDWRTCPFDHPDVRYRGRIDLIQFLSPRSRGRLTDFKTSQSFPSTVDWLQLEREAFACFRLFPQLEVLELEYEYVRFPECRPHREVTRADVAWVQRDLETQMARADQLLLRMAEKGRLDATPNQFCGWCNHASYCPATTTILQLAAVGPLMPLADTTTASRAATTIKLLEAATKQIKAHLKTFVEAHGPVEEPRSGKVYQLIHRGGSRPNTALQLTNGE